MREFEDRMWIIRMAKLERFPIEQADMARDPLRETRLQGDFSPAGILSG